MDNLKITLDKEKTPITESVEIEIEGQKFKLNETGDAIDAEGKVFKTKVELEALKKPSAPPTKTAEEIAKEKEIADKKVEIEKQLVKDSKITIDEVEYIINDKGDAVDSAGKVIKTKTELIELLTTNTQDEEIDYVKELQKATNIIINDDKGQPVVYENTVQGLAKYQQDVLQLGINLGTAKYNEELFGTFPILKDIITHLKLNNGIIDNFKQETDYSQIKLDKNNIEQCKDLYIQSQVARGIPKEEAEKMSKYLIDDKTIGNFAESGLKFLVDSKIARDNTNRQLVEQQENAAKIEQEKYDKEVLGIINSKTIKLDDNKVFTIPDIIKIKTNDGKILTKTPKDFIDYLHKPLNFNINGRTFIATQYEYDLHMDMEKETVAHDVFNAFRKFVKNDDSQLVQATVNTREANKILSIKTKSSSSPNEQKDGKIKLVLK